MILRAICTAVVVVGDIAVFLAFVIFGNTAHEITFGQTLIRTALPFGFVWVIGGLWLGAYKASTLYDLGTTMWKIPLIWLLCGLTALVIRAALTDASLILSFAVVSTLVQGLLLLSWRAACTLAVSKVFRQPCY